LTVAAIALAVVFSLDPGRYFHYAVEDSQPFEYHPGQVAVQCAFMALEAAFLHGVWFASLWSSAWLRALVGLVLFAPWTALMTMTIMHAPGYVGVHIAWAWLISLALLLTVVLDGAWDMLRHARGR